MAFLCRYFLVIFVAWFELPQPDSAAGPHSTVVPYFLIVNVLCKTFSHIGASTAVPKGNVCSASSYHSLTPSLMWSTSIEGHLSVVVANTDREKPSGGLFSEPLLFSRNVTMLHVFIGTRGVESSVIPSCNGGTLLYSVHLKTAPRKRGECFPPTRSLTCFQC